MPNWSALIHTLSSPECLLRCEQEAMPTWLAGQPESLSFEQIHPAFFASRVVYYPGGGDDGQPVKLFAGTHSAHCFVYADYTEGHAPDQVAERIRAGHPRHFAGYAPIRQETLRPVDLIALLRFPEPDADDWLRRRAHNRDMIKVFRGGHWSVLQRLPEFGPDHGPERFAFLYLNGEAVWLYGNLWAWQARAPWALVLQDHGFGGNCWHQFGGKDSPIYSIDDGGVAVLPLWLLMGEGTHPLPGYAQAGSLGPCDGGMHGVRRQLWHRYDDIIFRLSPHGEPAPDAEIAFHAQRAQEYGYTWVGLPRKHDDDRIIYGQSRLYLISSEATPRKTVLRGIVRQVTDTKPADELLADLYEGFDFPWWWRLEEVECRHMDDFDSLGLRKAVDGSPYDVNWLSKRQPVNYLRPWME